jgi:ubiquinol-cytochrome c reductase cytochrome b subunit
MRLRLQKNLIINSKSSIIQALANHTTYYPTQLNFIYASSFGSLVGLFFVIQLITGIFLAIHYTCGVEQAFSSVVYIMNDVKYGYTLRYMHANGAMTLIAVLVNINV